MSMDATSRIALFFIAVAFLFCFFLHLFSALGHKDILCVDGSIFSKSVLLSAYFQIKEIKLFLSNSVRRLYA